MMPEADFLPTDGLVAPYDPVAILAIAAQPIRRNSCCRSVWRSAFC